jgi:hypothetical protein
MFGPLWMRSRRKQYANLTQDQRDWIEREMIYEHERCEREICERKTWMVLTKENFVELRKLEGARDTAEQAIVLNEKWRSEMSGTPARSLDAIRWYWVLQDPAWYAAEMNPSVFKQLYGVNRVPRYT